MLKPRLRELLNNCRDLTGVAVVGRDGIPLDMETRGEFDASTLAAEFADVVKGLQNRLVDAKMGALSGMIVETDGHRILIEPIAADYFALGLVHGTGLMARARFQLRRILPDIAGDLR